MAGRAATFIEVKMLTMPKPDVAVLARRSEIAAALRGIVAGEGVIDNATEMRVYESDGLTAYKQVPMIVVLPRTTAQVSQILRYAFENKIKIVPEVVRLCRSRQLII